MNKTRTKLETISTKNLNVIFNGLNIIMDIEYSTELKANLFLYDSKWYYLEKYEIVARNTIRLYLKNDILMNYRLILPSATVNINNCYVANSFNSDANYIYDVKKNLSKTYTFPNSFNSELTNIMVLLRTY